MTSRAERKPTSLGFFGTRLSLDDSTDDQETMVHQDTSPAPERLRLVMLVCELSMGGAARVVRDHAAAFAPFAEVTEVVFDREDGVDFAGEHVESLDVKGGRGALGKIAALRQRVSRYAALKRRLAPDISISHLEGAHYVDLLAPGSARRVLVVHGSILGNRDIVGPLGWVRKGVLIPWLYRRADAIVAVSRDIEAELRGMGLSNVRTINNFFRLDEIESASRAPLAPEEAALFQGRQVLVTVGRLADQKKQAPLLDMMARLRDRPDVSLIIIGDGPLRGDLLDRARALGLDRWNAWSGRPLEPGHAVYFLGQRDNPFPLVRAADLFLLPSGWEGFPLALCEAMACGTPVVSTDCPTGPREILSPDGEVPAQPIAVPEPAPYGMLMPFAHLPETADAAIGHWARTVEALLDDPARRQQMAVAARRRVEDFARDRIVAQWRELFDELMERDRAS
jgi:glycosyltransferase involved in cell wall biosynthesis